MINIALPKGRLGEKAYAMLKESGYECPALEQPGRKLIFENPEKGVRYFWVKPSDVAIYVERGAADLGIVGKDILLEYQPDVYELLDLRMGKCRMAVAGKKDFHEPLGQTLKVATKFPNIAQSYYSGKCRDIDIIHLNGSIELAPILGLSHVIVDIVETGTTLRENNLVVYEEIVPISARLIANIASYQFKDDAISAVRESLQKQVEKENDSDSEYGEVPNSRIFARVTPKTDVAAVVSGILADVRENGDKAVAAYTKKFDGAAPESMAVTPEEMDEALAAVAPEFLTVLKQAAENIRAFHSRQVRNSFILADRPGIVLGQKVTPIEKVGVYVPGGTAAYPSTVLMDTIPAKIAGCPCIVMVTPPGKDGKINPAILAAASIAGVDRVFKVGGAQAIAALAYGTETIPKVDKIVGPGNAFVAEAKKQVFGRVAIDMIAGPSEILVIADGKSNPVHVAADLLSQAEHDRLASAVLVTDSEALAQAVSAEVEKQLSRLPREEIARASIDNNGKIIVAPDLMTGIRIANEIAPEHLELMVDDPFDYLDAVKNAGSIFLGRSCPEALGDYFAGPNHTLPTSGTARFSSPLSVDDFVKKSQFTYYTPDALSAVAEDINRFALKEGLQGHGRSVMVRREGQA